MDNKERASENKSKQTKTPYKPRLSRTPDPRSSRLLPPISHAGASCSDQHTPVRSPGNKAWSKYHTGCLDKDSKFLDWSAVKTEMNSPAKPQKRRTSSMVSLKGAQEEEVVQFLDKNPEFLKNYVCDNVGKDVLESWMLNKTSGAPVTSTSKSSSASSSSSYSNEMLRNPRVKRFSKKHYFYEILNALQHDPTEETVIWELTAYIVTVVGVSAHRLFKLYPDHPSFVQYFILDDYTLPRAQAKKMLVRADPEQSRVILDVAKNGYCRRLSRSTEPLRFPDTPVTLFKSLKKDVTTANHVMYQPILGKNGRPAYVIEMWRINHKFTHADEEISSNFLVLSSLALHYCNLYSDKKRERDMTDFLLEVVKGFFEEMLALDQLVKKILQFAQRLVNADRASLFLVDYRNYELVSTVFDLKFEPGYENDMEKKEIRMPINRGIAGHVALSGEAVNIPDAYSDYRFNREVDEATGYKTVSILCMPIKVAGSIIAVVQMVNKRDADNFSHEDQSGFEIFESFLGLALHNGRLYDTIMRKEQKYRVALEVLSYHNTCREDEVLTMLSDDIPLDIELDNYYLDPFQLDDFNKCKAVIDMFGNLFDLTNFDLSTLIRFILTVKKNYRAVPYHNFNHGWTVAHTMFVMLKNDSHRRFNYNMRLALFVACLCHDLDHRGYTNKYMSEIASPLAAMYTTSTLEHHHFFMVVTILQQDGHNIFAHIHGDDYKEVLGHIRHCILATDLARFFPNLEMMEQLHAVSPPKFNWEIIEHRNLGMAISMTAADLSASAKPWDIQINTVRVIFEEFYDQGDKEKAAGKIPIPMMDRDKPEEQPASQVGFLKQICVPCYKALCKIFPNTKPMYTMALQNLEHWKARADRIKLKQDQAGCSNADGDAKEYMKEVDENQE